MTGLLKSDLGRLWKCKLFYVGLAIVFIGSLYIAVSMESDIDVLTLDSGIAEMGLWMVIILGVIIPNVICDDYLHGMIRNKVASGHTRIQVFLSGLMTSITGASCILLAWAVGYFPVAIARFGVALPEDNVTATDRFLAITGIVVMVISVAAVSHLASCLISKKALVVAVLVLLPLLYATFVQPMILMVGYSEETVYIEVSEEETDGTYVVTYEETENPLYIAEGSPEKVSLQILDSLVTSGHSVLIASCRGDIVARYIVYDMTIAVLASLIGILAFKRKDIK